MLLHSCLMPLLYKEGLGEVEVFPGKCEPEVKSHYEKKLF